jgi:hypothetical protein
MLFRGGQLWALIPEIIKSRSYCSHPARSTSPGRAFKIKIRHVIDKSFCYTLPKFWLGRTDNQLSSVDASDNERRCLKQSHPWHRIKKCMASRFFELKNSSTKILPQYTSPSHGVSLLTDGVAVSADWELPQGQECLRPSCHAWSFLLLQPARLPRRYLVFALLQRYRSVT